MNEIERQILGNQIEIMITLKALTNDENLKTLLIDRYKETMDLLNPKQSEEPCCEMPIEEDALQNLDGKEKEVKKNE